MGDKLSARTQNRLTLFSGITDRSFKYRAVYVLSFLGSFLSLFILRAILQKENCSSAASILAPIIFILCLPYLQTFGGYYYDSWELMFLGSSVLLAMNGRWLILLMLAALATYNKESYVFFAPCLWPFLKEHLSLKKSVVIIAAMTFIAATINIYIKYIYGNNPGGIYEFHLFTNFEFYRKLETYFKPEFTYGLMGPSGANFLTIIFIAALFFKSWKYLSIRMREHALICACINLPLYFILGMAGEWRGLGFMYVTLIVLIAYTYSYSSRAEQKS
jgi:hypothetical protein